MRQNVELLNIKLKLLRSPYALDMHKRSSMLEVDGWKCLVNGETWPPADVAGVSVVHKTSLLHVITQGGHTN